MSKAVFRKKEKKKLMKKHKETRWYNFKLPWRQYKKSNAGKLFLVPPWHCGVCNHWSLPGKCLPNPSIQDLHCADKVYFPTWKAFFDQALSMTKGWLTSVRLEGAWSDLSTFPVFEGKALLSMYLVTSQHSGQVRAEQLCLLCMSTCLSTLQVSWDKLWQGLVIQRWVIPDNARTPS